MSVTPTKCQCNGPGYCSLMGRKMSKVRHDECQNKPHYFEMFLKESWRVPEESNGLGDRLAALLSRLGIRKRQGCGCEARQAWLNRLGERIARLFRT